MITAEETVREMDIYNYYEVAEKYFTEKYGQDTSTCKMSGDAPVYIMMGAEVIDGDEDDLKVHDARVSCYRHEEYMYGCG